MRELRIILYDENSGTRVGHARSMLAGIFPTQLVHWSLTAALRPDHPRCLFRGAGAPLARGPSGAPPGAPFAPLTDAMSERQIDGQTRSLIDQIDECLRDAERLRNHVNTQQARIWPDRRRVSRIPVVPDKESGDKGNGAG